jgi:hypothetical protein
MLVVPVCSFVFFPEHVIVSVTSHSENVIHMNRVCYVPSCYEETKFLQGLCNDWVLLEQDELSCIALRSLKCLVTFCPCCHTSWCLMLPLSSSPVRMSKLNYASRYFSCFCVCSKSIKTNKQTEQPLFTLTVSSTFKYVSVTCF